MKKIFIISSLALLFASCTENIRARKFGGTEEVKLKPNEKVLNVTWKETQMWILTQDTVTGITYFREKSSLGIVEGVVVFK